MHSNAFFVLAAAILATVAFAGSAPVIGGLPGSIPDAVLPLEAAKKLEGGVKSGRGIWGLGLLGCIHPSNKNVLTWMLKETPGTLFEVIASV
jgi:hypothetical protein